MFDPAVAGPLVAFFRTALARSAKERHDTAAEMLAAWRAVFAPVPKTIPDDADESAATAEPATPLAEAGLSARALSALEPYGVVTVGDLVAVDPVRLNRLSGVAEATRREVKARARQWRDKFGPAITGRETDRRAAGAGRRGQARPGSSGRAAAGPRGDGAGRVAAGHGPAAARARPRPGPLRQPDRAGHRARRDPGPGWPSRSAALQDGWADHPACRDLLDAIAGLARQALADFGGVATVDELAGAVLAALPPAVTRADAAPPARIAAGLLRLALDRAQALSRADAGGEQISTRRRGGRIVLLATDPALLDPAEALGRAADDLVAQARSAGEPLVPAGRGAQRLRDDWARAAGAAGRRPGSATGGCCGWRRRSPRTRSCPGRTSCTTATCPVNDALALALRGAGGTQAVAPHEIRDRVRARFPALPPLPDRPRLDQLISEAGLGLVYDDAEHGYRWPTRAADTKGLASRQATITRARRARSWSPAAGPGTGWRRARPPGRSSPSAWTPTAPTAPSRRWPAGSARRSWT